MFLATIMPPLLAWVILVLAIIYGALYTILHATQEKKEPPLLPTRLPFFDAAIAMARDRVNYLVNLRKRYHLPIQTLRMPFQRIYVINAGRLIQAVQTKANLSTFVPNLLEFGMKFSGLSKEGRKIMNETVNTIGNSFTLSVHQYLLSGDTLRRATGAAVNRLVSGVPNSLARPKQIGLLEGIRHELMLAMTGAVYGPKNPYDDPVIEASWVDFVPGIMHLLYSPFPWLTARKALLARCRIVAAFQTYFEAGHHLEAFPMVPAMYEANLNSGLSAHEAAKMEMATSLAMLSSGGITAFWTLYHILSNPDVVRDCRNELLNCVSTTTPTATGNLTVVDLSLIKAKCPTIMAVLHETLRYHSTLVNIKKVSHDTTLAGEYFLQKDAIVMIPGTAAHHNTEVWGENAEAFDHRRFLTPAGLKKLGISTAYRPFGAGVTQCPGRNFSINIILSLVAMVVMQYDVDTVDGDWNMPTKWNADLWNAMPKPDTDLQVKFTPRKEAEGVEFKFVWGIDETPKTEPAQKEKAVTRSIQRSRADSGYDSESDPKTYTKPPHSGTMTKTGVGTHTTESGTQTKTGFGTRTKTAVGTQTTESSTQTTESSTKTTESGTQTTKSSTYTKTGLAQRRRPRRRRFCLEQERRVSFR
jgi:cytochrome P450